MIVLTAVELPRFMQCNGSRHFVAYDADETSGDTTIRDEGIAAHWLAQKLFTGGTVADNERAPNGVYITPEIIEHVLTYLGGLASRPVGGQMEVIGSITGQNWLVKSRADYIAFDGQTLFVDDFKFGYRIVEPEHNWTMIAYAIEYCIRHQIAPQRITLTVHQPRAKHYRGPVREWSFDGQTLNAFYRDMNQTLTAPVDELQTGPHCHRCPALATCPAATKTAWLGVDQSEAVVAENITNDELSKLITILETAGDRIESKLDALKDLAFNRLKQGQIVTGYGLEQGLGNTQWKKFVTPEMLQALTGQDLTTKKLITPTQAKAKVPAAIIENLAERPRTGVKLRKMDAHKQATAIFNTKG